MLPAQYRMTRSAEFGTILAGLIVAVLIDIWVRQEGIIGQAFDRLRRLAAPRPPAPARRVAP